MIVVVEHLAKHRLVGGVAESIRRSADESLEVFHIVSFSHVGRIAHALEVRLVDILPAVFKLFGDSATAFREASVADVAIVGEHLTASIFDGFSHMRTRLHGNALVALTMVVGTNIEDGVVFAVVPFYQRVVALFEREEVVATLFLLATFLHLSQQPRARNHGMSLEKF